jgi:hypothetical protein
MWGTYSELQVNGFVGLAGDQRKGAPVAGAPSDFRVRLSGSD